MAHLYGTKEGTMQTLEFAKALTEIVAGLKVRELSSLLQSFLFPPPATVQPHPQQGQISNKQKESFASLIFESHAGYDRLSRNDMTGKILREMDAKDLYEAGRLARLVSLVNGAGHVQQIQNNQPEIYDFYETLRAFARAEKASRNLLLNEKIGEIEPSNKIIELQLIDYENQGVEPERLAAVALTLVKLYADLAMLLAEENHKFSFKYVDSGSDFILGVLGAKKVVDSIGPLFLQFWDKVMFRHPERLEKDIEAMTKSLAFMEKAKESVDKGAITKEEAEILKARVFKRADELIGLGVSLPLKDATIDQRKLLVERRDMKLLGTGDGANPKTEEATGDVAKSTDGQAAQ